MSKDRHHFPKLRRRSVVTRAWVNKPLRPLTRRIGHEARRLLARHPMNTFGSFDARRLFLPRQLVDDSATGKRFGRRMYAVQSFGCARPVSSAPVPSRDFAEIYIYDGDSATCDIDVRDDSDVATLAGHDRATPKTHSLHCV